MTQRMLFAVLYPVGPPFYHAQYTVLIQCVWSDTLCRDDSSSWREFSWTNIAATERLNSHVAKVCNCICVPHWKIVYFSVFLIIKLA